MAKLRVAQYGCGKTSALTMKYVFDCGGEIVAAFDIDSKKIGLDIGDMMQTEKKGIIIQDAKNARLMLQKVKPDACIVTTMSLLEDVKDELIMLAELGIDTVTSCEEAFFPWNSSGAAAKKIDEIARKNNCTICGTGYQDMSWCSLAVVLAGSCKKVDSIKITTSFNLDNYGVAPSIIHGAGMEIDNFPNDETSIDIADEELLVNMNNLSDFMPSFAWNSNGWLCDKMGFTVKKQTQQCIPHTYDTTLSSKSLDMDILAGCVVGMTAIAVTETEEGVTIITESIGKVYSSDETDVNICKISGEPNISCELEKPENVKMACTTIVGRIPDVINAEPGFITSSRMPVLTYRSKSLDEYVNKKASESK